MTMTCIRFGPTVLLVVLAGLTSATYGGVDEKGSLLVFPHVEIRWDDQGNLIQDTFISLQNDFPADVRLQLFYVNGDPPLDEDPPERAHPGWNHTDSAITMTQSQPIYWSTAAPGVSLPPLTVLDPWPDPLEQGRPDPEGSSDRVLRAFVYVFAIGPCNEQINWNHLSGRTTVVHYRDHTVTEFAAVAYQALAGETGDPVGIPGEIRLDGVEFTGTDDRLHLDFQAIASPAFSGLRPVVSDTDLTLQIAPVDLRTGSAGPLTTKASFVIWNENEFKFDGTERCITCWDHRLLSGYSAPNAFQLSFLQTNHGRARIDGVASPTCDDPKVTSTPAPLHGVSMRVLEFDGGADTSTSGVSLRGDGVHASAVIRFDHLPPPDCEGSDAPIAAGPAPGEPRPTRITTEHGSLLVYPNVELRWAEDGQLVQDTFITLQNLTSSDVTVRLHFVNGDPPIPADPPDPGHPGWNHLDSVITLTLDQPVYWSATTGLPAGVVPFTALDPGDPPGRPDPEMGPEHVLRGTIYAWAINDCNQQIRWNNLSGGATIVNYPDGTTTEYRAYASAVVDPQVPEGGVAGTPGVLELDGNAYAAGFDRLLLDFVAVGSLSYSGATTPVVADGDLSLLPLGIDFRRTGVGPIATMANFTMWNENETQFSGAQRCVTCWDQTLLSNYGPPNFFLIDFLQTNRGRARVDGISSALCDDGKVVSEDASLLGVFTTVAGFDGGLGRDAAATTLRGFGTEAATVRYDVVGGACPADLDGSGDVGFGDLLLLLAAWGPCCCPEDLDGSGDVGFGDLLLLLASWGPC
jgi:hypothetical protein